MTLRWPVEVPDETLILTRSWVGLRYVTETIVIPEPENDTDAGVHVPPAKPVPLKMMSWFDCPRARELGLRDTSVGPWFTVNPFERNALPPSGLRTVTVRAPRAALDEIEMFTVAVVGLVRVAEFTVMPLPENETDADVQVPAKLEPVSVIT